MENRHDEISASDLLAKLKANMADGDAVPSAEEAVSAPQGDVRKTYKFRRSDATATEVTEEEIRREMPEGEEDVFVTPVPKSDIEDLDIDALMKKYLPEEDYAKMAARDKQWSEEEETEMVRTLTSMELAEEKDAEGREEGDAPHYLEEEAGATYAAPDSVLFADLSAGGKVCDVPGEGEEDQKSDTRPAPLRPMTDAERTLAFGSMEEGEEEAAFASVRELLATERIPEVPSEETASAETTEVAFVDEAATVDLATLMEKAKEADEEAAAETEDTESEDELVALDALEDAEAVEDLNAVEGITDAAMTAVFTVDKTDREETDDSIVRPDLDIFETVEFDELEADLFASDEAAEAAEETADETESALPDDLPSDEGDEDDSDMTIAPDVGFDETDANLMLAFGMDEELDRAIGKETADKLRDHMDELIPEEDGAKAAQTDREPEREFIAPAESKDIMENYKAAYGRSVLCLFGAAVIAVMLFFYENVAALGGTLADAVNPAYYPVVNVMVGLQILLIGFALCYKQVLKGFQSLREKKPTPESFLPILLGVSVLYSVAACFFPAGTKFVTFHFPASLCLVFTMIGERLDLRREIMTFNVVSSKRTKFALEKLELHDAELETRAFDEFLPQSPSIFKINKTAFVDGYFRRTQAYPTLKLVLNAFLPATAVALAVGVLVGAFKFQTWQDAIMLGYTVFSFCMPASIFLAFGLPAFKAAKIAYDMKSAFVGEAAIDEYTTAASISFDDREVFPTGGVKIRSINVFGSGRIDTVIYNVASVYAVLGGPLSDVLNVVTADFGHSENTEILAIENEGVEALVDEHHLYIGKADYLRQHGYAPISDPDDEEIEGGGDLNILYLVSDDEVVAKLYVRYRIDPEFEVTLKNLYRSGICVGIKTVDPNINDAMLSTRIRLSKYPVRVLKYSDVIDSRRGSDRTDSGIVSKKSAKALLRTFTLCDKVKHVTRSNLVVSILTMVVGLILSLAVAMLGTIAGISSVYVALFQLFWLVPVYLLSRFMLL